MRETGLVTMRYVLPLAICVAGIVLVVSTDAGWGPDALSALFGAGGALLLINQLLRGGMQSNDDRDREEVARMFFDRYGLWPDEVPADWRAPDGADLRTAWRRLRTELRRSQEAAQT